MFAYRFRTQQFDTLRRMLSQRVFAPSKPRHPLLRIALGLVGVALLAVLVVIGLFVGAAMLLGGLALRLVGKLRGRDMARTTKPQQPAVEGEYRVVGRPVLPSGR